MKTKQVNEKIQEGQMIYIPAVSARLEKILHDIKSKNPSVPDDISVLLLREGLPNAYTLGTNSLFVNLGLFYYLENEDQIAAVLSHEIGHLAMAHTLSALKSNYEKDKENAADVKSIRRTETKKADRAFDLLKNSIYKKGKLRRTHELEADSAGYAIFRNTGYGKSAFTRALYIIERYENGGYDSLPDEAYRRFFDLPGHKFQDKWLKVEDFSSYNYKSFTEKFDEDSISSHPKSKDRIAYLKTIFPELNQPGDAIEQADDTSFHTLKLIAEKQRVPNLYFNERYGEAVYLSLLYLQRDPQNLFYKIWLGKNFQQIYQARKDYQLNRYLDRIMPEEQTQSYIRFLSFMWNLNLDEIKNIADFYSSPQQ